jgi:hypothetical protein
VKEPPFKLQVKQLPKAQVAKNEKHYHYDANDVKNIIHSVSPSCRKLDACRRLRCVLVCNGVSNRTAKRMPAYASAKEMSETRHDARTTNAIYFGSARRGSQLRYCFSFFYYAGAPVFFRRHNTSYRIMTPVSAALDRN